MPWHLGESEKVFSSPFFQGKFPPVGATFMVARGWGVLRIHLAHIKGTPIPAGDREGRPYGLSDILPIFMA